MIVCVSANPALDVRLRLPRLELGAVQRVDSVRQLVGGKAVHVALAAHTLQAPVLLVGLFGGSTGERCQRQLAELLLPTLAVPTQSETRRNLEILDGEARATELLEPGGPVEPREVELLVDACTRLAAGLGPASVLVLSGSLPRGAPVDLFARLVTIARRREVTTVVDTSGAVLEAAVAARPDWIKPNHEEAGAVVGFPVIDSASALDAARALRERGARRVIVSRGRHGLVALSENGAFEARAPAVGGSGVGCGDATVAGLAVATLRRARNVQALKFAVACGSANCRAPAPGRLSADHVNRVLAEVEVAELAGGST